MAMPKSVTKVRKDGIEFTSNVAQVEYTIHELSRAALRDVAKLLRNRVKQAAPKATGNLHRNIGTWVRKGSDGEPYLQIGIYDQTRAKKKGLKYAFYAHFLEFGTSTKAAVNGGRGFLRSAVTDSLADVAQIQAKYLKSLDDQRMLGLIDEEEEIADD